MSQKTFIQFFSYNIVGIANTIVGFSIIFLLMLFGVTATESNIIGYAVGSVVSYFLNKKYTFKSKKKSKKEALKFFTVLLISYGLNMLTLQWLLEFLNPYLSQIFAAIVYTLSSFILVKIVVFKEEV